MLEQLSEGLASVLPKPWLLWSTLIAAGGSTFFLAEGNVGGAVRLGATLTGIDAIVYGPWLLAKLSGRH